MVQPDEFEVWYTTEDFPDTFNRTGRMVFTVDALAHALFVTGRAPQDQAVYGWTSVYEWLHRVALIPAYIRRAPTGRLTRSDLARDLDRSEKVALSYTLGQAMTGVFSQQTVSVRFLMHVDRYAARSASGSPPTPASALTSSGRDRPAVGSSPRPRGGPGTLMTN